MIGYWRAPEYTAQVFRNLWYHTGDAGYKDEQGRFYFVDRLTDSMRRRGENISSMELEAVVNDAPTVVESAAIGVPSELGEEDIKLFVVPSSDGFDPLALMEYLQPRLPRFMMPRYIVAVDELPKTPTEKVRKHELRANRDDDIWDREDAGFMTRR